MIVWIDRCGSKTQKAILGVFHKGPLSERRGKHPGPTSPISRLSSKQAVSFTALEAFAPTCESWSNRGERR